MYACDVDISGVLVSDGCTVPMGSAK
jgi:hypothetical protein